LKIIISGDLPDQQSADMALIQRQDIRILRRILKELLKFITSNNFRRKYFIFISKFKEISRESATIICNSNLKKLKKWTKMQITTSKRQFLKT